MGAVVLAFGCHGGEEEAPEPGEYFNLKVGSWWAYSTTRGSGLDTSSWTITQPETTFAETSRITAENNGVYTWVMRRDTTEDTSYLFVKADTLMLAMVKRVVLPTDTTDTLVVSDTVPFATCPLVAGSRWSSPRKLVLVGDVDGDSLDDTVHYHLEAEVVRAEALSVPAGDFTSYYTVYSHKFDVASSSYGQTITVTLIQRLWWVPNVGVARWVDKDYRETPDPIEAPDMVRVLEDWQ